MMSKSLAKMKEWEAGCSSKKAVLAVWMQSTEARSMKIYMSEDLKVTAVQQSGVANCCLKIVEVRVLFYFKR